jgi:uncharacterized Zn-finger protein
LTCKLKFKKHIQRHKELEIIEKKGGFECPQCYRKFAVKRKFDMHVVNVHQSSKHTFMCDICSKELATKNSLQCHIEALRERLPCHICGNKLANDRSLQKHLKKHEKNKQGPFTCKECGAVLNSWDVYKAHIKYSHRTERTLQCSYCPKMLKLPVDLKEHEATHTGIDLYSCNFCDKKFKFGASYRGHRKREHPEEYEKFLKLEGKA